MASAKMSGVRFNFKDAVEDWGWENLIEDLGKETLMCWVAIHQIGAEKVQRYLIQSLGKKRIREILDEV